jgi:hypothetical protein
MLPGTEDTLDPSNGTEDSTVDPTAGANESTAGRNGSGF